MSNWSRYLEKQGKMFGGAELPRRSFEDVAKPYQRRDQEFLEWAKKKAVEEKTPLAKAVGVGGLSIGTLGGLLGAAVGGPKGALAGGTIGALGGGAIGALGRGADAAEIELAKKFLAERALKKQAKVFGERQPESIDEAAIPYSRRKAQFMDYARRKAEEGETPLGTAVGVGGLTGGALGTMLGAGLGRRPLQGALMGLGGGALVGGGLGGLLGLADAAEVARMKGLVGKPSGADEELSSRIVAARAARRAADRTSANLRHAQLLSEIQRSKHASVKEAGVRSFSKRKANELAARAVNKLEKYVMRKFDEKGGFEAVMKEVAKGVDRDARQRKAIAGLFKKAGTPFLEQDRPAKVKEIYSALKRDHPNMPAEMKARIAARQGKPGKQKQGPPYKGPLTKGASLNQALGVLYDAYGPPKTKHAAANYFFYEVNRGERAMEALGAPFCKLAHQSDLDPWDMALGVVRQLPELVKTASQPGPAGDLARFYLDWADEIEKRANIFARMANAPQAIANIAQRGASAVRAGAGAARQGMMSEKALAAKGVLKGETPGVREAVRRSLAQTKHMQEVGGGSVRRGRGLIQRGEAAPLTHGPPPAAPGPVFKHAPPPAPGPEKLTPMHYALGAGALTAGGAAGTGLYNAMQPQPQFSGAYA